MRTLQEKYNAIQEGKFSKDHFLAEARMQQPQLITRFNGYDDAVQILKNRGMIAEAYSAEEGFKEYSNDALADMIINLSKYEDNEDSIARVKAELERRKEAIKEDYETVDKTTRYDVTLRNGKHFSEVKFINRNLFNTANGRTYLNQEIDSVTPTDEKLRETVKEARLNNKSLTDYRYKVTNEMDKYPYEQILRGIRVELEVLGVFGTPTAEEYAKALAKVSKNLAKDSIFYTNQLAGVNPKVDLHDKMVDATAKNTVDTFNGMKKAALKEGFKKLIKKVLSEEIEEEFQLQEAKEDSYYKSELSDYLDDNGIFGYTDMIHDIMTGPDEEENLASLADFLDDHQIYGYSKGIERIYADYPYDQHWMNQPDEDEADDIPHPRGYEEPSDEEDFDDLFEGNKSEAEYGAELDSYLNDNQMQQFKNKLYTILTDPNEETVGDKLWSFLEDYEKVEHYKNLMAIFRDYANKDYPEDQEDQDLSPSDRMYNSDAWVQAQRDMMEGKKSLSQLLK